MGRLSVKPSDAHRSSGKDTRPTHTSGGLRDQPVRRRIQPCHSFDATHARAKKKLRLSLVGFRPLHLAHYTGIVEVEPRHSHHGPGAFAPSGMQRHVVACLLLAASVMTAQARAAPLATMAHKAGSRKSRPWESTPPSSAPQNPPPPRPPSATTTLPSPPPRPRAAHPPARHSCCQHPTGLCPLPCRWPQQSRSCFAV